jgi:hypothetical protein
LSEIVVVPNAITYEILLTLNQSLSHHDPAVQDKSNRLLFNRQKQRLEYALDDTPANQEILDAICKAHPLLGDMAELGKDLTFPEFIGAALIRIFLDIYNPRNNGDGEGLFVGKERYVMLEARFRQAAICAATLRSFWNRLVNAMQVSAHPADYDQELAIIFALPKGIQHLILRSLADDYRSIMSLARLWYQVRKEPVPTTNLFAKAPEPVILQFDASSLHAEGGSRVVEVPAVSANSARHQMVREPAWLHLFGRLGLMPGDPGKGPVPAGVEALFYNGGNIEAGAKQPSNPFALANEIRKKYPSLDLLGGVTDSFDLGESRLRVGTWIVCKENARALSDSPAASLPSIHESIFDLIDDETRTRMAGKSGQGQMIYNYESLCAGTQILVRFSLQPFTPILSEGALLAALKWYLAEDRTIGGQAARGHGDVRGEWLIQPKREEPLAAYEQYLDEHAEELRQGLVSGTLGTNTKVVS